MVTKEVTILLVNPSVTNDKKAALIEQTGEKNPMKNIDPKTKTSVKSSMPNTMKMDGTDEIENQYEDIEYDDAGEIDYDLDYTH